jgi:hypothetical protein
MSQKTDPPPAVRILPMSSKDDSFSGRTVEQVQQEFFLDRLPFEQRGRFRIYKQGLKREDLGATVLFQFANWIIASAVLTDTERYEDPEDGLYKGAIYFDVNSIKVFEPVPWDVVHEIWPNVTRFSRVKWRLDPRSYPAFERKLRGVETPRSQT